MRYLFYAPSQYINGAIGLCFNCLNYYQGGMKFFKPETITYFGSGTTGQCCTSEIQFYYTVALLYQAFGYHDSIYRIFNTLLFLPGLFYLFRLLNTCLMIFFANKTLSLLLFTSPVLVYYGNNYLSNSSAWAFSISAGTIYQISFRKYLQNGFTLRYFVFFLGRLLR